MFDAVVVDIDHSPAQQLAGGNAGFYGVPGTARLAERLRPGGVFSLWSNDPPDETYLNTLAEVSDGVASEVVTFANPLQDRPASNTVYLATKPG